MADELTGQVINTTDWEIDPEMVMDALRSNPEVAALTQWASSMQTRTGGLVERDRYVTPDKIFDQFNVAYDAAENDDVVAGVLETTESLAMGRMTVECDDEDQENVWTQIIEDIDLPLRMREMWRELFIVSQVSVAVWHGRKSYKVKGKSQEGVRRKKTFGSLRVPLGMTVLDPHKVVPIGAYLFSKERLYYAADRSEKDALDQAINNGTDPIASQLLVGPYTPTPAERRAVGDQGFPTDRLYLMNPRNVFRVTATRPPYKPFADVRLKSIFELLDLKNQLRAMDRAHLLGSTNFILLIRKGSDTMPAKPAEIANLNSMVRVVARVPVIVGDHRLSVDIITPKTDQTLEPARYNGIDSRITSRLFQLFSTGNFASGARGDDSIKLAKVAARGLEAHRNMLARSIEKNLLTPVFDTNDEFTEEPQLRFHPKHVALDFDPALATYLLDLRDRGDISRETILEEIDYDQDTEFQRRKLEKERYDDAFEPTNVPFSGNAADTKGSGTDPKAAGRNLGGNRSGGGSAPGTGQGKEPRNPGKKSD